MCAVCGLPTAHPHLLQILGAATFVSLLVTFIGSWWILKSIMISDLVQQAWKSVRGMVHMFKGRLR